MKVAVFLGRSIQSLRSSLLTASGRSRSPFVVAWIEATRSIFTPTWTGILALRKVTPWLCNCLGYEHRRYKQLSWSELEPEIARSEVQRSNHNHSIFVQFPPLFLTHLAVILSACSLVVHSAQTLFIFVTQSFTSTVRETGLPWIFFSRLPFPTKLES